MKGFFRFVQKKKILTKGLSFEISGDAYSIQVSLLTETEISFSPLSLSLTSPLFLHSQPFYFPLLHFHLSLFRLISPELPPHTSIFSPFSALESVCPSFILSLSTFLSLYISYISLPTSAYSTLRFSLSTSDSISLSADSCRPVG